MSRKKVIREFQHYKLLRDIPLCPAGSIFYYDYNDQVKGSISSGCLKLSWIEGHCQNNLCSDTIIFHANAISLSDWFQPISYEYVELVAKLGSRLRHALSEDIDCLFTDMDYSSLEPCNILKNINLCLTNPDAETRLLAEKLQKLINS